MGVNGEFQHTADESEQVLDALEAMPWRGRAILLVDLDAFFASVEQLDHPGWRGKPVIVGGSADKRGVVSTASYEARKYGVHSAMASSTARRLCPDAIWTNGHFARYREMSQKVMGILFDETPHVLQVSIDEAFLDVTPTKANCEHPVAIARRIQRRVDELGVSCSIGVGTTKSIAKIASDMDKPHGLTVVFPGGEEGFLAPLPVRALSGIGASAEARLRKIGIETLGDLANADDGRVERLLGKNGATMLARVRGLEDDDIEPDDEVKSVSNELSFAVDLTQRDDIIAAIATMAAKVGRRLRGKGLAGKTLALKVRYDDRSIRSVQCQLDEPSDDESVFMAHLGHMLDTVWHEGMALRLVGVSVTDYVGEDSTQLSLFDERDAQEAARQQRARQLIEATDRVRKRFGDHAVNFGRELRTNANTTGSSAKNPEDYK